MDAILKLGSLTFYYSNLIDGYYADIGNHQIQIVPEKDGHWNAELILNYSCIGHSPEEVLSNLECLINEFKEHLKNI